MNGAASQQAPQPAAAARDTAPVVLVIEDYGGLSRRYRHVFDYLGIRLDPIRSVSELARALNAGAPLAVIWDIDAAPDPEQVGDALAERAAALPLLIIGDDETRAGAALHEVRLARGAVPTHLVAEPGLHDVVEFVFRAGRHTGQLRVLSV